jgi:hypothetical protein
VTNLSSFDDDTRDQLLHASAWSEARVVLSSTNIQLQRAAVEFMTNLVGMPDVLEKYAKRNFDLMSDACALMMSRGNYVKHINSLIL